MNPFSDYIAIFKYTYWRRRSWAMWAAALGCSLPYALAQPWTLIITIPGWLMFVPSAIWLIDHKS